MWRGRFSYPNPFTRNHCVVHAWTHLSNGDASDAQQLAEWARRERQITKAGRVHNAKYEWWASAVCLKIVRHVKLLRVRRGWSGSGLQAVRDKGWTPVYALLTLEAFAAGYPRGRFYVRVRGHAVAVIDGQIYGSWKPRSLVQEYLEVV